MCTCQATQFLGVTRSGHWYRPNGLEIQEDDESVQFANSHKRLILSNIKLSDAGTYDVEVAVPLIGTVALRARTGIDLIVEGKCVHTRRDQMHSDGFQNVAIQVGDHTPHTCAHTHTHTHSTSYCDQTTSQCNNSL